MPSVLVPIRISEKLDEDGYIPVPLNILLSAECRDENHVMMFELSPICHFAVDVQQRDGHADFADREPLGGPCWYSELAEYALAKPVATANGNGCDALVTCWK